MSSVVFIAEYLLSNYGVDENVTFIVDKFDIVLCPIVNVDGYKYTWINDTTRLWRKTRSPNAGSDCVVTDPNSKLSWIF